MRAPPLLVGARQVRPGPGSSASDPRDGLRALDLRDDTDAGFAQRGASRGGAAAAAALISAKLDDGLTGGDVGTDSFDDGVEHGRRASCPFRSRRLAARMIVHAKGCADRDCRLVTDPRSGSARVGVWWIAPLVERVPQRPLGDIVAACSQLLGRRAHLASPCARRLGFVVRDSAPRPRASRVSSTAAAISTPRRQSHRCAGDRIAPPAPRRDRARSATRSRHRTPSRWCPPGSGHRRTAAAADAARAPHRPRGAPAASRAPPPAASSQRERHQRAEPGAAVQVVGAGHAEAVDGGHAHPCHPRRHPHRAAPSATGRAAARPQGIRRSVDVLSHRHRPR